MLTGVETVSPEPVKVPSVTSTWLRPAVVLATSSALASERTGSPGFRPLLRSLPEAETKTARAASPSMPSQLASRPVSSGSSVSERGTQPYSQPLEGSPSMSRKPSRQVSKRQVPPVQ